MSQGLREVQSSEEPLEGVHRSSFVIAFPLCPPQNIRGPALCQGYHTSWLGREPLDGPMRTRGTLHMRSLHFSVFQFN